jgi:hypothetical protein
LGSGLAVWAGINSIVKNKDKIKEKTDKIKGNLNEKLKNNIIKKNGGISMNNGFIKLAVFSFIGIIISAAVLTMLPQTSGTMGTMNMQGSLYGQTGMNSQSNMNMQGMSYNGMQGNTYNSSDINSIQQQLYNIQQQINQLQYQMNSGSMYGMSGNYGSSMSSNMNNSSMNSNMNNMNNNSMNNSNMNNSNMNSSSSMPMM